MLILNPNGVTEMPHRDQKTFDEGWKAWGDGSDADENPYPFGAYEHRAWLDGWSAAEEDHEHQESERDNYGDRADWEYDRDR